MGPFGFLSKLAGRPSTILGLAWLLFCLAVMLFFGAKTLSQIYWYALSGMNDKSSSAAPEEKSGRPPLWDNHLVNWVIPIISWAILASFLIRHFVVR